MTGWFARKLHYGSRQKIVRFGLVGFSNMIVSYSVFLLMIYLLNVAFSAQAIGYGAGIAWSFTLNRFWTFQSQSDPKKQFVKFVLLQLSLLLLSSSAIGVAVDYFGLSPSLSWLGVMILITLINYLLSSRWVFLSGSSAG